MPRAHPSAGVLKPSPLDPFPLGGSETEDLAFTCVGAISKRQCVHVVILNRQSEPFDKHVGHIVPFNGPCRAHQAYLLLGAALEVTIVG